MELPSDSFHIYRNFGCSVCGHPLRVPISCGNRFCRTCRGAAHRSVRAKIQSIVQNVVLQPGERFRMLTLSIKNSPDIKEQSRTLLHAFRKLRQRQYFKRMVSGGAFVLEVKGTEGAWHVHIHAVVASKYFSYKKMLKMWTECSGGTGLHIMSVHKNAIVNYISKYVTKSELATYDQQYASLALKGARLFNSFGSWLAIQRAVVSLPCICPDCGNASWYGTEQGIDPATNRFYHPKGQWDTDNWMVAEQRRMDLARGDPLWQKVKYSG